MNTYNYEDESKQIFLIQARKFVNEGDYVMAIYSLKDTDIVKSSEDLHNLAISYCKQNCVSKSEAEDFIKQVEQL